MEPIIHFGLPENASEPELIIVWPDGKQKVINRPEIDRYIAVDSK